MIKSEQYLDLEMLFNSLRSVIRLGWHYTLYFSNYEVVVSFHAIYLDDGFEDFIKDLMNLSIFKCSNTSNTILIFSNPYDV